MNKLANSKKTILNKFIHMHTQLDLPYVAVSRLKVD